MSARHPNDDSRIDDLDRHLAARVRLARAVATLCRRYRREFPAHRYAVTTEGSHRAVADVLRRYGGLPETTDGLNGVPAAALEAAVVQLEACFGLGGGAASGPLPGASLGTATADPTPRNVEAAPW